MRGETNERRSWSERTFTIIVNGRKKEVATKELSYADIINLAYDNNPPTGPNIVITVTFKRGENDKQGTLLPGDSIKIKDGMIFNVTATDKS